MSSLVYHWFHLVTYHLVYSIDNWNTFSKDADPLKFIKMFTPHNEFVDLLLICYFSCRLFCRPVFWKQKRLHVGFVLNVMYLSLCSCDKNHACVWFDVRNLKMIYDFPFLPFSHLSDEPLPGRNTISITIRYSLIYSEHRIFINH